MTKVRRTNATRLLAVILFVSATIAGCGGNPVTQSNYEKIKNGMSQSEVEAILGKGKEQASSGGNFGGISMDGKSMVWQNGNEIITVMFMNGEVMSKAQVGLK